MAMKISVITASRNVESTLPRLYGSLAAQTYDNFEWVVADGLSTDTTVNLLRQYSGRSPWVRFSSERDFGIYDALNKAIATSDGEFYVVAGADDFFDAHALTRYAEFAERTEADVVLARVSRGGRVIGGLHPNKAWIGPARVFGGSHSVGMLFRKNLHARFGMYSRRFPLLADSYFLKTLLRSGSVKFVDADFVAGEFADTGATAVNKLQVLAETFQIQMLTERRPLLQMLLTFGKMLVRYPAVKRELQRQ